MKPDDPPVDRQEERSDDAGRVDEDVQEPRKARRVKYFTTTTGAAKDLVSEGSGD